MVVTNNCRAVNDYHPQMEVLYKLTSVLSFTMSHALLSSCNLWETASPTPGLIVWHSDFVILYLRMTWDKF